MPDTLCTAPKTPHGRRIGQAECDFLSKLIVILDPGHGGTDPGAVGNGTTEAVQNLAVALTLKFQLEQEGFEVRLTRTTGTLPGPAGVSRDNSFFYRCNLASLQSTAEPFAFVSVHHDIPTAKTGGVYFHPARPESRWFAQALTRAAGGWCRPDTEARQGSLYVIRHSPARRGVLWEVGPVKLHSKAERVALCAPLTRLLCDIRDKVA